MVRWVVGLIPHGAILAISRSSQCSMTGIRKPVVCVIQAVCGMLHIKETLL